MTDDPFSLARFVLAQEPVMLQVRRELAAGRKQSHWMWFVFPQLAGLGHSPTARHYAISGLEEARAYFAHPVLGPRLRDCTALALRSTAPSAAALFGSPDDMKFRSSMTLFAVAGPGPFQEALDRFHGGQPDPLTTEHLQG